MMDWLFRWRRQPAHAPAPYRAVDMTRVSLASDQHRETATATARSAIDAIERQQERDSVMRRIMKSAEGLRDLTNDALSRTQRR